MKNGKQKRPLVVSIDFDFFVEEDPMLDMGHREEGLYLETLWQLRAEQWKACSDKTMAEMMPMSERPESFVKILRQRLRMPFCETPVFCAESHAVLPKALDMAEIKECDVVNFDAHHDLTYGQCPKESIEKYDCGSWAGHLIQMGRVENYTQVYPEWRRKWPEMDAETQAMTAMQWQANFFYWSDWQPDKRRKVAAVFLCRSGCWTPPCYDKDFSLLCRLFGVEPLAERKIEIDENRVRQMKDMMGTIEAQGGTVL